MSELTTAQRSKIRRLSQPKELAPDEEGGELNIVPFLDIIMNILIFVLATVAVTFTATPSSGTTGTVTFTSGSTALATARLRGAGLEPPAVLITANSIERGKPDPEPFLMGAQQLGVAPKRCLALEDAPSGIESANAAGMKVVAFRTSHPEWELEGANEILDTLAEAVEFLGRGRRL